MYEEFNCTEAINDILLWSQTIKINQNTDRDKVDKDIVFFYNFVFALLESRLI